MAVEQSTLSDTRCVCTHDMAVHGIKNDPGCSFCSCRHFERPTAVVQAEALGKYPALAFDALNSAPELKALPREALTAFVRDGHGRIFAPGDMLVHRGEKSHTLHVVLNGTVLIQNDESSSGHEAGAGDIAGDLRAFTEDPRWASVYAVDTALALEVDTSKLRSTFAEHPDLFMALVQSLGRFSENTEEIVEATVQAALEQHGVEHAEERHDGLDPAKQMQIAARWRQIKEEQSAARRARDAARAAIDSQVKKD